MFRGLEAKAVSHTKRSKRRAGTAREHSGEDGGELSGIADGRHLTWRRRERTGQRERLGKHSERAELVFYAVTFSA